jgi:hypothetical protein
MPDDRPTIHIAQEEPAMVVALRFARAARSNSIGRVLAAEIRRKLGRALACSTCQQTTDTAAYLGFEDVLTSNVFGALRYLELRYGLEPVMRDLGLGPIESASIEFWHEVDGCEPDVIIDVGQIVVIVETKLKADFGPDQLPREVIFAHRRANGRPWRLLCVTDDFREPVHHRFSIDRRPLKDSLASLGDGVASYFEHGNEINLSPSEISKRICWMPWSQIATRLQEARQRLAPPPHALALIDDLLASLEARGLTRHPFHGFSKLSAETLDWTYTPLWGSAAPSRPELTWSIPIMTGSWDTGPWSNCDRRFGGFFGAALVSLNEYSGWFSQKGRQDG